MKLGIYLWIIILFGAAFDFIEKHEDGWFPPKGIITVYPLRPLQMHFSSHVYYSQETINYILIALIPVFFKRNHFLWAFIILECLDLIDYLLTGNRTWFNYHGIDITFNLVKALSFGILLSYGFVKRFAAS